MAYDEKLAQRVRRILAAHRNIAEKKMMGALCFMLGDHMCCGVTGSDLMTRVGRNAYEKTLAERHVRPMEIAGRRSTEFVLVDADGFQSQAAIEEWIQKGIDFASALPPKS